MTRFVRCATSRLSALSDQAIKWPTAAVVLASVVLIGCSKPAELQATAEDPPWVRTVAIVARDPGVIPISGTIRAQTETPIAFQIGGRILTRSVHTGQTVSAGTPLFALDPQDINASANAAQAQAGAAEAAWQHAIKDLERQQRLVAQGFVSAQTLDRYALAVRDGVSRRDAARATLRQSSNAQTYTQLRAPYNGVLLEVMAEAGQVVSAGTPLAVLAAAGPRDVEVFLPADAPPPASGQLLQGDGSKIPLRLREITASADPQSRTRRARYAIGTADQDLILGSVVSVQLAAPQHSTASAASPTQTVPLAALDERNDGPRVWRIENGQAQPKSVEVVRLDAQSAQIRSALPAGEKIIALGTHLLTPGMAVRELSE